MTDTTLAHQAAALTTIQEHIDRFWRMLETEHVRLSVYMRRDSTSVPYWDSSSFPDEVAKALVADRARLTAANKALTEQLATAPNTDGLEIDGPSLSDDRVLDIIKSKTFPYAEAFMFPKTWLLLFRRTEAAEAKLAKVEAELADEKEAHRLTRVAEFAKISYRDKRFAQMEAANTRLSAELAEARKVLEFYADPFDFVTRNNLDEATPDFYDELDTGWRARSFLASNAETAQPSAGDEQRQFHGVLADAQKFNDSLPESIRRETRSFLSSKEASHDE